MNRAPSARIIALALILLIAVLAVVACSPATGQPLKAIHAEVKPGSLSASDANLCLNCHSKSAIVNSTESYDGQTGLNIHEPPASMAANYGACVSCHKLDDPPTLSCNTKGCHDYKLPKGWSSP